MLRGIFLHVRVVENLEKTNVCRLISICYCQMLSQKTSGCMIFRRIKTTVTFTFGFVWFLLFVYHSPKVKTRISMS